MCTGVNKCSHHLLSPGSNVAFKCGLEVDKNRVVKGFLIHKSNLSNVASNCANCLNCIMNLVGNTTH